MPKSDFMDMLSVVTDRSEIERLLEKNGRIKKIYPVVIIDPTEYRKYMDEKKNNTP